MVRAAKFEASYRGKIEAGPSPELLLEAVQRTGSLSEQMDRPAVYAGLLHAAKTDDPKHGALLSRTREQRTVINKHLIFFDLEWVKLADDAGQEARSHAPTLARYRHFLEAETRLAAALPQRAGGEDPRREGRHRPGGVRPPVRRNRLDRCMFPFTHGGKTESLSMQQINAKLYDADRTVRKAAAEGLTKGLQDNARLLTYIFNNLVLDHKIDCELRQVRRPDGAAPPGQRDPAPRSSRP